MTDSTRPPLGYESTDTVASNLPVVLGFVGLRLLGVQSLVAAASGLPSSLYVVMNRQLRTQVLTDWQQTAAYLTASVGPALIHAAIGMVLFAVAPTLSVRLFGRVRYAGRPISATQALALLIAAVGLLAIIDGLPGVTSAIANVVSKGSQSFRGNSTRTMLFDGGWITVLIVGSQPIIGALLVAKAHSLSRWGMRRFGRDDRAVASSIIERPAP